MSDGDGEKTVLDLLHCGCKLILLLSSALICWHSIQYHTYIHAHVDF